MRAAIHNIERTECAATCSLCIVPYFFTKLVFPSSSRNKLLVQCWVCTCLQDYARSITATTGRAQLWPVPRACSVARNIYGSQHNANLYYIYSPTIYTVLPYIQSYHIYSPTIYTVLPYIQSYHIYSPTIYTVLPYIQSYHIYSPTPVIRTPLGRGVL